MVESAWGAVPGLLSVRFPRHAGVRIEELVTTDAAANDERQLDYLFLADTIAMADEHLHLAVDLHTESGRSFRVPASRFADVSADLAIANLDFADFADGVDESGTYLG